MSPIPVEIIKQHNDFFDYVSIEAILTITLGGLATLGGAYLGARKAGESSLKAVEKQISHAREEKESEAELKRTKYEVFLKSQLRVMNHKLKSIDFLMGLHESHNIYNVEPLEETKKDLTKIEEILSNMQNWDPDCVSIENFKLIGELRDEIHDIESSYEAVLATEEEEHEGSVTKVRAKSQKLAKKITQKHL
ncbi:hypothetical protein AAV35_012765 [Salimicrobium jeotgali]|uniref:Uncharacterized protein n=1 Tax=Salimicrobium jeotgali TaxID=1230341 RepID=K2G5G2_9BACI|nr:hypothetical protein [Salimicrobium jeotgali]AKG05535.1 hypothetical protein AAV35_012765 [Salimicrobium jeotgali]EKE30473.1 hypothetical protein MJ3_13569 [Salimicrobium jeotgali]MBM7696621.1 hypothetical protein [Salimicrobium jeotgali]